MLCYVGKATKIFIFIVTAVVVLALVLGFGPLRHSLSHHRQHSSPKCSSSSSGECDSVPSPAIVVSPPAASGYSYNPTPSIPRSSGSTQSPPTPITSPISYPPPQPPPSLPQPSSSPPIPAPPLPPSPPAMSPPPTQLPSPSPPLPPATIIAPPPLETLPSPGPMHT
ncbi:hypothetical protein MLD38_003061 [Melastoma candidum]|uniref:Uncharacterized protein n=1 Tax=Melastoma candidum TaxID=119954 RepID=A0ACB9S1L9_9MYRT|nr:hypothetical protein MLD38_003061 [Melastoma candidum]